MSNFKNFVLAAVLAVGGMGGAAVIDSPVVGGQRAEAGQKYWYVGVALTMNGRTYTGYLGGYTSQAQAYQMYNNWVRGVGTRYNPHMIQHPFLY